MIIFKYIININHTMKKRSILSITLSKIIGLLLFFIFIWALNHEKFEDIINQEMVNFLNMHIWFIIALSLIFYFGELFYTFKFPLNIVYPIFNIVGSILLLDFLFKLINLVETIIEIEVFAVIYTFKPLIYIIIPLIVLIVGYLKVYESLNPKKSEKTTSKNNSNNNNNRIEWADVTNQYKLALFNLGSTLKNKFNPDKKK